MTEQTAINPAVNEKRTNPPARTGRLLLLAFGGFLFFYGLGSFGLLGADEPRYAQVAREMLNRSDWVTPTLQGKPWLEKPVLYYWQAMLSFRALGVSDAAARIPSAFDAALLAAAIYFFLKRFCPGTELDGTLITVSCAGIIGFAHAAATDMPLAAFFSIALLAWYGWYECRQKTYLAAFYIFLALGTLAKGPVAPALSAVILFLFIAVRRDWRAIAGTLWIPGIALYLVVMLPWYVAVQMRNPDFFRVFILEHNLARFSQDVYHHRQPFWFYLPVFLLAMMPWTLVLILAVVEPVRAFWGWRNDRSKEAFSNPENAWPLFLFIWMLVPILFFSLSQSKLPGYILPAVPAGALLAAEYLATRRSLKFDAEGAEVSTGDKKKLASWFVFAHCMLCGVLIFSALSASFIVVNHRLPHGREAFGAYFPAFASALIMMGVLYSTGFRLLSRITALAVAASVFLIISRAAPIIDATQSARPIAERILAVSQQAVPLAIFRINRLQQYGLEFYLNRAAQSYESGNIPSDPHVVVAARGSQTEVAQLVPGRRVSYLTSLPEQNLDVYWVGK